jgi:hypothetical protein
VANSNPLGSITVSGTTNAPAYGNLKEDSNSSVILNNGFQVSHGSLSDSMAPFSNLTVNGNSTIGNGGSVTLGNPQQTGLFTVNGTVTLSPLGTNTLDLTGSRVTGPGTIAIQGENDVVLVDDASGATHFAITGGKLKLSNPQDFNAIIGPSSANVGAQAIGIFGEVEIFNAQSVTSADFAQSTHILSLLNASGGIVGSIQFSGDASALRLSTVAGVAGSAPYLSITDGPGTGTIPIKFL